LREKKEEIQLEIIELKNELKSKNIELNDLYEDNKKLSNRIDVELSEIKVTY